MFSGHLHTAGRATCKHHVLGSAKSIDVELRTCYTSHLLGGLFPSNLAIIAKWVISPSVIILYSAGVLPLAR